MRNKIVYKYIGKVLIGYSFLVFLPFLIGLIYKEFKLSFILAAIISLSLGFLLNLIKIDNKHLYARDGFKIVTLSWIIISLIGAIPICIDGKTTIVNSIFEAISGFTTTGATIFSNTEVLPKSLLFWRDFMHFIGGMGVLAFAMAIIPLAKNDKSMHVLKAEMLENIHEIDDIKKSISRIENIKIRNTLIRNIIPLIYYRISHPQVQLI